MAPPSAAGMVKGPHRAEVLPSADLDAATLRAVRRLMDAAFAHYTDEDWEHALGGVHALVRAGEDVVAHGSLGPRRLRAGAQDLHAGYVESVAVAETHRRRGLGGLVMAALEARAEQYDVLALSASTAGRPLYLARGWRPWVGPTHVLTPEGPEATPGDDGKVCVWHTDLDLTLPLACDWRSGDVW